MMYEMYLMHHGIKGQRWGVKNGPPYPLEQHSAGKLTGAEDPKALSSWMKKNVSYADYTTLKSPSETVKRGKGSCHDQVLLELEELRSMGYDPKATFFIEYSPKSSQGGTTHAFVTYEQNGKTYWFENAWGGQEGLHEFNNLDEIKSYITKLHKSGKTGDSVRFPNLEFSDFGEHKPGESLQELVDRALATEDEEDKKVKHSEEGADFKMTNNFIELSEVLASLDPDYLEHHQIKGAKWGVKRGPPYPLESGIRTKIKKFSSAAKKRVEENRKQKQKKQEEEKKASADKTSTKKLKKKSVDEEIAEMSDEELRKRIQRLQLENNYKNALPREKTGQDYLRKTASVLQDLKTTGDAIAGLIQTGKKLGKAFGLDDSGDDFDSFDWRNWKQRKKGETEEQYSKRLNALSNIRQKEAEFTKAEEKEAAAAKAREESSKPVEKPKATSTAKTSSSSNSSFKWNKDAGEKEDPKLSSLREQAKKWNVDIDAPVEKVFDYSAASKAVVDKGKSWLQDAFPKPVHGGGAFDDFVKENDDKKKKKGG